MMHEHHLLLTSSEDYTRIVKAIANDWRGWFFKPSCQLLPCTLIDRFTRWCAFAQNKNQPIKFELLTQSIIFVAPNHIRQQIPPVRRLVKKDPLVRIKMLPHPPAITDCSTRSGLSQAAPKEKCIKKLPCINQSGVLVLYFSMWLYSVILNMSSKYISEENLYFLSNSRWCSLDFPFLWSIYELT